MSPRSRPVALVTGASSGIGLELAKVFAFEGYDLIISSDNRAKLKKAATQITPINRTKVQIITGQSSRTIEHERAPSLTPHS
jgi:short-subunit dehydrogenase